MRNADMPAMPWSNAKETEFGPRGHSYQGLSKREYLAAMALPRIEISAHYDDYDAVAVKAAQMALATADAILAELEKTQ